MLLNDDLTTASGFAGLNGSFNTNGSVFVGDFSFSLEGDWSIDYLRYEDGTAAAPAMAGPVIVVGETLTVAPGIVAGGGLPELEESDNMDLRAFRDPISINAVTQFVLTATSPTASPTTFDFTLEGNCVSRPNVVQRIELFNYFTRSFETVDERNANRTPNPDLTVTVSPGGDLSRFVDQATNEIQARVRYRADIARAGFASNTDQAVWTIE
jgi:hypothetical protein